MKSLTASILAGATAALTLTVAIATQAAPPTAAVNFPTGYRDWKHVKSMVIQTGHPLYGSFGGIHHLYANRLAVKGYAAGRFPDGAVIVFDLLDVDPAGNAISEGARKIVGVMAKDSKRFATTGGWGFEGFAGGDPKVRAVGDQAATACFGCHEAQRDHDYVFSALRP